MRNSIIINAKHILGNKRYYTFLFQLFEISFKNYVLNHSFTNYEITFPIVKYSRIVF
jgi:hypothetical protein